MSYQGHRDQKFGHISYSQHFEDGMLLNIFDLIGIVKPSYLDIGAHHPEIISNTKLLYDRGSRGVNVEANPNLISEFNRLRPEDKNLNIGVGVTSGESVFYMYSDTSGRNTFSFQETKTLEGVLEVRKTMKLPVLTLNQIVTKYCDGKFPDLLSCDIEGFDYAVLSTTEFGRVGPKVIIVETRRDEHNQMVHMLNRKSYFLHCRMGENLIFVYMDYLGKVY